MHTKYQPCISVLGLALISASCCLGQQALNVDGSSTSSSSGSSTLEVALSGNSTEKTITATASAVMLPSRQPTERKPLLWSILGKNPETGFFAVGNFNMKSNIYIQNVPHNVVSSNKSSLGGGFETRRYFGDTFALGFLYTQNPSDGKLLMSEVVYLAGSGDPTCHSKGSLADDLRFGFVYKWQPENRGGMVR